ncbi:very-long-chain 3-oxoacyl-CoA reductase [Rhypophila sp. PSN 637]
MPTLFLPSILSLIGASTIIAFFIFVADFVTPFLRPSQIHRFLHSAPAPSPSSSPLHPWALVTGTTAGIGLQLCHQLASLGFNVVLHGRNPSKLEQIQKSLSAKFPTRQFRTLIIDATAAPSAPDSFKEIVARLSDIHLTVLINNAGGIPSGLPASDQHHSAPYTPLSELSHSMIAATISLNLTFPVMLTSALLPILSHRNNGPALVMTVGSFADNGLPLVQVYAGAKAGLCKAMEAVGRELNIRSPPPSLVPSLGEKKKEVVVHHMRIGNVTGVSHSQKPPSAFRPDATIAAQAIIARVGCGRTVISPHWSMALQSIFSDWAPWWVKDHAFGNVMAELRDEVLLAKKGG